jgi:hypothetical protein
MLSPHHMAWQEMEADRAFRAAKRRRRREALAIHDQRSFLRRGPGWFGVREIPLDAIVGTFDAGRARDFDGCFRPTSRTRRRWLSVWLADALPPITVTPVDEGFVVLDGHHRVSVARARGARTIPAVAG